MHADARCVSLAFCLWLSLAWPAVATAVEKPAAAFSVKRIAAGVFVHAGAQALADPANHGDIANIGFIAGSRCVAVIDTGGSPRVGRQLKNAIARKVDKPVCFVINTHMHPDHVLGNGAFADTHAVFVANARLPEALAARASTYLDNASKELAQEADASWIVLPDRTVKKTTRLDLGDRTLLLRAWPTAHTNNDLSVYDAETGTLWLSDLLFVDRVPSLDGGILGWLAVLENLENRNDVKRVVPGHGPIPDDWRAAIGKERDYLRDIKRGVRAAIDNGHTLQYAVDHVARSDHDDWLLFDDYNTRNVTQAYTELEWQ